MIHLKISFCIPIVLTFNLVDLCYKSELNLNLVHKGNKRIQQSEFASTDSTDICSVENLFQENLSSCYASFRLQGHEEK